MSTFTLIASICATLEIDPLVDGLQILASRALFADNGPLAVEQGRQENSAAGRTAAKAGEQAAPAGAWCELQGLGAYVPPLTPFPLVPTRPALICGIADHRLAAGVQAALLTRYPADHPVVLVHADHAQPLRLPLAELDRAIILGEQTCAYLAPLAPLADLHGPEGVGYVVARLLGPGGCPWDREQTHHTLRPALLEEAHEVIEALDAGDMNALTEELGDLLLNVLMHAEMGRQAGAFDSGDVYAHIATKLIRRHPHVFGSRSVSGSGEVLRNWEAIKHEERAAKGQTPRAPLDGIPVSLPALMAAQALTHKAAKTTFDWPTLPGAWEKLNEELAELREAVETTAPDEHLRAQHIEHELGDVLFAATNLARRLNIDAESALRAANARFRRRFEYVHQQAQTRGIAITAMKIDEIVMLWEQAKALE